MHDTKPFTDAEPPRLDAENTLVEGPGAAQAGTAEACAAPRESERKPRIHLLIGPVGAGKSTFALGLAREHRAVRLTLDEWMVTLFSPDRPSYGFVDWYVERAARCVEQIWATARALSDAGADSILEIGLLQRAARQRFYERVERAGCELVVYALDASRELRRERVERRNRLHGVTFSMPVPPEVFEFASDLWEPPEPSECVGRQVRFIRTDAG